MATVTAVHPVSPGDEEVDSSSEGVDDDNDGAGSGSSSLAALQQLGLRSTADLMTLVAAAKYVERTARAGDEDMAVARGKVGDTSGSMFCAHGCRCAALNDADHLYPSLVVQVHVCQ
jgi:hypothetical protein